MRADEQDSYYASAFAGHMAAFVRYKRAQGLAYKTEPTALRAFSRFIAALGLDDTAISQEVVDEWCRKKPNERWSNQRQRATHAAQFLAYLAAHGVAAALPQTAGRRRDKEPFAPYVFTQGEVTRLFAAADQLKARSPSVMPAMLPVLFRLLYSSGLRISEALNLTRRDVDLETGCLTVRHAKFDQDRLVPLSPTMSELIRRYDAAAFRAPTAGPDALFFTHRDGRPVTRDSVYRWFRKTLWSAGISHGGPGKGPRLHDWRHTMAVHSLKAMTDRGTDIHVALPALSTYLGHSSVSATGGYVRLTQDMFPEVVAKVSALAAYVIPAGGAL
jgi:integrase